MTSRSDALASAPDHDGVVRARHDVDETAAATAAIAFAVCTAGFHGRPRPWELRLFTVLNEGAEYRPFRVPQQLGTPWALPLTGGVLWLSGRPREAAAAVLSLPLSKGIEVATKKLLRRPRPLYETPTVLRDDAPVEGPSYPSGHAAIAAAGAYLLCRAAPRATAPVAALTVVSSLARVRQGAHWPTDALGGAALGVAIAASLRRLLVPR